jgi:NitT/TauT family transport system permease protein
MNAASKSLSTTEAGPRARRRPKKRALPPTPLLTLYRLLLFLALVGAWHLLVVNEVLPEFFFGRPALVALQIWNWFASGKIFVHLGITLVETFAAFALGVILGVIVGLWLGLSPLAASLLDPYVKALNAMPRVILAPIFIVWFGLGMGSKIALGVTLVVCVVFFNVFQGVREVSVVVLNNSRVLGATRTQLLRTVYLPSAMSWVFSSLHTSVGMAFVGAVVGEYLGSAKGIGYLILQAESVFDINAVFAGIIVLTLFALLLDFVVTVLESRFLAWRPTWS